MCVFFLWAPAETPGHLDKRATGLFKIKCCFKKEKKCPAYSMILNLRHCRQMKISIPVHGHMIAIQAILFWLWQDPGVLLG